MRSMMTRTMRAAQYHKKNNKVLVQDVPIPVPKQDQILVKIAAASLCHSDLMMSQRRSSPDQPITIGHEAVGIISELHPSAEGRGFKTGDKIGMMYIVDICFSCEGCQLHGTLCMNPSRGGAKIQGLQADGFFSEYAVIDWRNAIHLPDTLPIEKMSPLFCAGLTAFHAVDKCGLKQGQWLAVVGCGGLGQMATRYAKAMGLMVVGLDINDLALDLVIACGADAVFNPRTNLAFYKELRKYTSSRGCHAAAVFSDSVAAYKTAEKSLMFNGTLMVVGLPEKPLELPAVSLSLNMIRVKGASNGTAAEMKKAIDFTAKHQIVPEVEFRRLEEMPQMWNEMARGDTLRRKVVLFCDNKSKI